MACQTPDFHKSNELSNTNYSPHAAHLIHSMALRSGSTPCNTNQKISKTFYENKENEMVANKTDSKLYRTHHSSFYPCSCFDSSNFSWYPSRLVDQSNVDLDLTNSKVDVAHRIRHKPLRFV